MPIQDPVDVILTPIPISRHQEYTQNVGIASPDGALVNWDIKAFTDSYHMETVPGSKQWIQLLKGNVKANLNVQWPVRSYLNNFQVCTQITWDISDADFALFLNNNVLPGQSKNLTAPPTVLHKLEKSAWIISMVMAIAIAEKWLWRGGADTKDKLIGFSLIGPYTFAYLWPGEAGFTFLSKNPYAKSGEPNFSIVNVTLSKAK